MVSAAALSALHRPLRLPVRALDNNTICRLRTRFRGIVYSSHRRVYRYPDSDVYCGLSIQKKRKHLDGATIVPMIQSLGRMHRSMACFSAAPVG